MKQRRKFASAAAAVLAVSVLSLPGAALAHGEAGEHVNELQEHMSEYAGDINAMIGSVNDIVSNYEAGDDYADEAKELIEQWESVEFHEAVESRAMPLYPPIWAAIGAFSTALKEGAPAATVQAKGDAIAAALWQGYGALKLLATRDKSGHGQGHADKHKKGRLSNEAVLDTIDDNLDRVLVLYKEGNSEKAQELIFDTYMNYFEGIEGDLIEQDADLVSGLEADFNATLPQLVKSGAPASEVDAQIDAMQDQLDKAEDLLEQAEQAESSVF